MRSIAVGAAAALMLVALTSRTARTDAPAGRYTVATDTVLDTKTGLTWQRVSPTTRYNLATAKTYCATITGVTGTGWRLPTAKELATLIDFSQASAFHIDPVFNVPSDPTSMNGVFWTATAYKGTTTASWTVGAWTVYFKQAVLSPNDVIVGAWVRCVR